MPFVKTPCAQARAVQEEFDREILDNFAYEVHARFGSSPDCS